MLKETPDNAEIIAGRRAAAAKKRRLRKALVRIAVLVICLIIAAVVIFFALFRIKTITVKAPDRYTSAQVIEKSGLETGKNLFLTDYDSACESIEKMLPYCDNVKITKKLPSTVVINAAPANVTYSVIIGKGVFAITNEDMKVLEVTGTPAEGTVIVEGHSDAISYETGSELPFTDEPGDDPVKQALSQVSQAIAESEITGIEYINVEDKNNIYLIYDGRIIIRMGSTSDALQKITLAGKAIAEENRLSSAQYGEMDVTQSEKAVFAPKDYKNMDELVAYNSNTEEAGELPEDESPEDEGEKNEEETEEETGEAAEE